MTRWNECLSPVHCSDAQILRNLFFLKKKNPEIVGNITSEVTEYLMLTCVAGINVRADVLISEVFGNIILM